MISYKERENDIWEKAGGAQLISLATSVDGRPSVRTMSAVFIDRKIYFQTDRTLDKAIEIRKNPRVAVSMGSIQFNGICKELGHPFEAENERFLDVYSTCYKDSYKQYSHLEEERVYEINPELIKVWGYRDGYAVLDYLFVKEKRLETKLLYCNDAIETVRKALPEEKLDKVCKYLRKRCSVKKTERRLNIVFDLLHDCDISCIGCGTNARCVGSKDEVRPDLSYDDVITILNKIKEYSDKNHLKVFINYGGGEPFWRDDLEKIVKYTYELFGDKSVGIDTNATLPGTYERLMDIIGYIDYLGISINGLHDYHNWWANNKSIDPYELATGVVRKICGTEAARNKLEITSVATAVNRHELPQLMHELKKMGVKNYSIHRAIPVGRLSRRASELVPSWRDYLELLADVVEAADDLNMHAHIHHSIEAIYGNLLCGLDTLFEDDLVSTNYRSSLGIEQSGELVIDPWCTTGYWKELSLGNLLQEDHSIEMILEQNSKKLNLIRESYNSENRCCGCERKCAGGSRIVAAVSYMMSVPQKADRGNLYEALREIDPACPLSERRRYE